MSTVHWEQRSKFREATVLPKTPALSQCKANLKKAFNAVLFTPSHEVMHAKAKRSQNVMSG